MQLHPSILRSTQFATIEFEYFAEFDIEKLTDLYMHSRIENLKAGTGGTYRYWQNRLEKWMCKWILYKIDQEGKIIQFKGVSGFRDYEIDNWWAEEVYCSLNMRKSNK